MNLDIYDKLREFHKNELLPLLDIKLNNFERCAIETLSGVLYLVEGVFCKDD